MASLYITGFPFMQVAMLLGVLAIRYPRAAGVLFALLAAFAVGAFFAPGLHGDLVFWLVVLIVWLASGTGWNFARRSSGWIVSLSALSLGSYAGLWVGVAQADHYFKPEVAAWFGVLLGYPLGAFVACLIAGTIVRPVKARSLRGEV